MHEDLARKTEVKVGSERSFGIVFAVVFLLVALLPLLKLQRPHYWPLAAAAAFLACALLAPHLLRPLNLVWFRFGLLLHRVVSPVILGLLFYLTVTPIALIYRLRGKDPLRLALDRQSSSYWIHREPPGPDPETMRRQF